MTNETATAAFIAAKAEIDALLAKLTAASEDHFGQERALWSNTAPAIHWGHVGDLKTVAALLRQVVDVAPTAKSEV